MDVDAISDGEKTVIGGIMEHIEEAGIHSGDSDCVLPPYTLVDEQIKNLKTFTYGFSESTTGARSDERPVCDKE